MREYLSRKNRCFIKRLFSITLCQILIILEASQVSKITRLVKLPFSFKTFQHLIIITSKYLKTRVAEIAKFLSFILIYSTLLHIFPSKNTLFNNLQSFVPVQRSAPGTWSELALYKFQNIYTFSKQQNLKCQPRHAITNYHKLNEPTRFVFNSPKFKQNNPLQHTPGI